MDIGFPDDQEVGELRKIAGMRIRCRMGQLWVVKTHRSLMVPRVKQIVAQVVETVLSSKPKGQLTYFILGMLVSGT